MTSAIDTSSGSSKASIVAANTKSITRLQHIAPALWSPSSRVSSNGACRSILVQPTRKPTAILGGADKFLRDPVRRCGLWSTYGGIAGSDTKGVELVRDAADNGHPLEEGGGGALVDAAHHAVSAAPPAA